MALLYSRRVSSRGHSKQRHLVAKASGSVRQARHHERGKRRITSCSTQSRFRMLGSKDGDGISPDKIVWWKYRRFPW